MSTGSERLDESGEEAARACERDTCEALELLLGAVEALRSLQRVQESRGSAVTWLEARRADYLLGLAEGLSAALAPPVGAPLTCTSAREQGLAHAVERALAGTSFLRAPLSVWEREVTRHGGGELPLDELEGTLQALARVCRRREGPLWRAGLRLTRLADGSYRASRRSQARRRTDRGSEGGVA